MKDKKCDTPPLTTAEQAKNTIQKVSKTIHNLTIIVMIYFVVYFASTLLQDIWIALEMPIETHGWFTLLRLGEESGVYIPILPTTWTSGHHHNFAAVIGINLFASALFLVAMLFVKKIFKELRDGGNPFNPKIIGGAKIISVALAFQVLQRGDLLFFFPAAITYLFAIILDYGRVLKEESDTML